MNIAHINELGEIQSVEAHCIETAKIAKNIAIRISHNDTNMVRIKENIDLSNVSYLTGLLHDLGKETKAFTKYIQEQHEGISKQRRGEINHSTAGAQYLMNIVQIESPIHKMTGQLITYAIAAHHGIFDIYSEDGNDHYERRIHPDKDIYYDEAVANFEQYVSKETIIDLFEKSTIEVQKINEQIKNLLQKFVKLKKSKEEVITINQFAWGCVQRLLLSIVIDADRLNTNEFMSTKRMECDVDTDALWKRWLSFIEKKIQEFPKDSRIASLRGDISKECFSFANNGPGIYRLSCPTGGGKTLASFRYALGHAIQYQKQHIIYIAPYRAILEQNCEVIRDILKDSEYILEHHSDVIPEDNEKYQYLTGRWSSPLIFTTMVQFLNTLFSNQTQSIRRFHSLTNSIIIVDEVQSLPMKCIQLFNQMMNFLAECCNATIILCTATQPALDEVKYPILFQNPKDMIQDIQSKYNAFKRVNIVDARRVSGYDISDLRDLILQKLEEAQTILVIVNTKDTARKCYDECKEYIESTDQKDVMLYHLSTNMCPQHRMDRLNNLRDNLENNRVICISTQLIEAGVDISFQCVIRSFTGLDSIAQAAGRCNRNGKEDCKEVLVVNMNEEKIDKLTDIKMGQQATGLILDTYKLQPEVFDQDLLSVKAMDKFYERYYFSRMDEMAYSIPKWNTSILDMLSRNMKGCTEAQRKPDFRSYMLMQAFETAGKEFEVIDSKTTGILVPYKKGTELINNFNGTLKKQDLALEFKLAQRYTVNVYQQVLHQLEGKGAIYELMIGGIYALSDGFYDNVTGLQLDGYNEFLNL